MRGIMYFPLFAKSSIAPPLKKKKNQEKNIIKQSTKMIFEKTSLEDQERKKMRCDPNTWRCKSIYLGEL
jgi:hypothetical protein